VTIHPGPVTHVRVLAVRPERHLELPERLATEEPLELRVAGLGQEPVPVAVTMRTPGHDFELAAGFLLTEGLIDIADVRAVGYCDAVRDPAARFNTVTVTIGRRFDPDAARRNFLSTSSCGVCGTASIDLVEVACAPVGARPPVPATTISALPGRLRAAQRVFDETGGLHAAGLFDADGGLLVVREDVGRHNAVDKVIGQRVLDPAPPGEPAVMMVSGRIGFEIAQKAAMGGIGIVAAVSAPSSLAARAAERLGVCLAGFVRGDRFNIYTHPERIALDEA
jgi:FdhD protein